MLALTDLLSNLRAQGAPASQLQRLTDVVALARAEPALQAIFLVGSYARGTGDRVSDLDLAAFASPGQGAQVLRQAEDLLLRAEVFDHFTGQHPSGGAFCKLVYLDFSSVEFHVFEPGTAFRLRRPWTAVWDPGNLSAAYAVAGEPIRHEDFAAYGHGDAGLIWELFDCVKWLSRGRTGLARHHIMKLADALSRSAPPPDQRPASPAPPHVTYRAAVPGDASDCIALRGQTRQNAISAERLASIGITAESWGEGIRSGSSPGHVCLAEGTLVGYGFGDTASGEVVVLALLPAFEGRGIGRQLLGKVVDDLSGKGWSRLFLYCSADPVSRSYGFYRRLGWRPTGTIDGHGDEMLEYRVSP